MRAVDAPDPSTYARRVIRVAVAVGFALALIAAGGCGSDTETQPGGSPQSTPIYGENSYGDASEEIAEEEWDAGEGDAWGEFNDGYLSGWESGCDLVFAESPDGSLYDQGVEFTAEDCYDLAPFDASDTYVPEDIP